MDGFGGGGFNSFFFIYLKAQKQFEKNIRVTAYLN